MFKLKPTLNEIKAHEMKTKPKSDAITLTIAIVYEIYDQNYLLLDQKGYSLETWMNLK